jgi:phytoene dehydrogenase-like protein
VKRILGKIDGVNDVQTDVAAKTVVVQADPSVSPQLMLEKLQKVSNRVRLYHAHEMSVAILLECLICAVVFLTDSGLQQVENQLH